MKKNRALRGLKYVLFGIVFAAVFGFVVMSLWNWLMPAVFGWHVITYWQALGLLILSKILFGGMRGRSGPKHAMALPHDGAMGADDARGTG